MSTFRLVYKFQAESIVYAHTDHRVTFRNSLFLQRNNKWYIVPVSRPARIGQGGLAWKVK